MFKQLFLLSIFLASCNTESINILEGSGPIGSNSYPIINGVPAGPEHGAVVGLHRLTKRRGGSVYVLPFCTGTLIAPDVVLTAGHCLDKSGDGAPTEPMSSNDVAVYFGDAPGELDENGNYDVLNGLTEVSEVLIYPNYNKFSISNDVGLLRLRAPATQTPVHPMNSNDEFILNETLTLVGFGEDETGAHGVKLTANVALNAILSDTQIEHLHLPEGICFGDSGGPALISRETSLVGGVASYVTYPYCANTGAHSRVDAYTDWITSFITLDTEPPSTCEDLLPLGSACSNDFECCSNKCKGRANTKTCK